MNEQTERAYRLAEQADARYLKTESGKPPICPECIAGKHRNCLGDALDPATDEITDCVCVHEV